MKRSNVTKLTGLTAAIFFASTTWAEKMADFETLDQNQDGKLTPSEVTQSPQLTTQWAEIDRDESGTLDRQEFSAFEEKEQGQQPEGMAAQQPSSEEDAAMQDDASMQDDAVAKSQGMQQQGGRIDHPLYSMSPDELKGQEVQGADGKKLGTISKVVSDRSSGRIHVVVSHGGFMGLASSEHAFPLDNLQMQEGTLRAPTTEEELKTRSRYTEDAYVEVEPEDRPISEFAAFEEPMSSDESRKPSDQGAESDQESSTKDGQ